MIPLASTFSRRELLRWSIRTATGLSIASSLAPLLAAPQARRFKIGACDWSIGKMDNPEAFEVARQIGLDGVQVSLGTEANNMHLRQPEVQKKVKEAARAAGLEVASLAIGELNNIPYKEHPHDPVGRRLRRRLPSPRCSRRLAGLFR